MPEAVNLWQPNHAGLIPLADAIGDFTLNTSKYVFKGIAEFATESLEIITGDTSDKLSLAGLAALFWAVQVGLHRWPALVRAGAVAANPRFALAPGQGMPALHRWLSHQAPPVWLQPYRRTARPSHWTYQGGIQHQALRPGRGRGTTAGGGDCSRPDL
jgi:hypothetical protein